MRLGPPLGEALRAALGSPTVIRRLSARLHSAAGPDDAGALPAWAGPGRADARAFICLAERFGCPSRLAWPRPSTAWSSG